MKQTVKKTIIFVIIFCLLWALFQLVLSYKWDTTIEKLRQRYADYENEDPNSIDVLFIGSSPTYEAYLPIEIYHETGISSINFGTSNNRPLQEYYNLQYALETQTPKIVIIDFVGLTDPGYVEYSSRDFVMNVPSFPIKVAFTKAVAEQFPEIDFVSYPFPLLAYHSRWNALTDVDFDLNAGREYPTYLKGNCMWPKIEPSTWDDVSLKDSDVTIEEYHLDYYRKLIAECKDRGIEVIMVPPPRTTMTVTEYELSKSLAEECGIDYWDLSTPEAWQEIGLDPANCYADGEHLNTIGARIYSDYIAHRLAEERDLPDHRGEAEFADWDELYIQYDNAYYEQYVSLTGE